MRAIPHFQPNRKSPWEARWYVQRRLKSRFFQSEKERDQFIREFNRELKKEGSAVFEADPQMIRQWQEAHSLLPHVHPLELVECWMRHNDRPEDKSFSAGAAAYLKSLELAGRDPAYRRHARKTLERFTRFCDDGLIRDVSSEQVSAFILESPFKPVTQRHSRSNLSSAFKWFIKQRWADHNPVLPVPVPKVVMDEPGILTVEETEALFRANEKEDPGICALLALGAFAGMRSSAIVRLSREELDFKNRAILTPASKTKKGRRQFIEGLPENLWPWLERAPAAAFKMTPRQYALQRQKAFERAGLLVTKAHAKKTGAKPKAPPKNCLRHSFVSYHVALHRDPGRTALLVSHKDQAILWEHYLGVAKKEDAERYFGIGPS